MEVSLTVAIVGLSGSGKTALIETQLNNHDQIFPTAGINIRYISPGSKSSTVLMYDCSGQPRAMPNWGMLTQIADSVVYVIDSSNEEEFETAKKYLELYMKQNKAVLKKKNMCIVLNKSDIPNRRPKEAFYKALQVEKTQELVHKLYIKETSAFNKDGFEECLDWLLKSQQHSSSAV